MDNASYRILEGSRFFYNRSTVGFFLKKNFLKMFSGTNMIYFDGIILLIFLEKCDFLKLTMQGFTDDKNGCLNEYLFFYWMLAHFIFQKQLFSQVWHCGFSSSGWWGLG